MKLSKLFADDRGVSPVVGVVILIAITVVLAAVVAGVVLGLGSDTDKTPSTSFEFTNTTSGQVQVEHAGGDELNETNLKLTVDGTVTNQFGGQSAVTAGATRTVSASSGDTVRIIWMDPGSDKTTVLAKYEA